MKDTLLSYGQSRARHVEKTYKVLSFLRTEKWSHQNILQALLQLRSRQAIHKTLMKMESQRLIKRHSVESGFGQAMTIWGITPHGVMMSIQDDELYKDVRAFEYSKLKATQLNHTIDIQYARVKAESAEWADWQNAGFAKKGSKNPDAIALRPDGKKICFEIERSLKAFRRYQDILVSHLAAKKEGRWDEIYYLMPDTAMKKRVERIFSDINTARYQKRTIAITSAHKAPFKFFTLAENWHHQKEEATNV